MTILNWPLARVTDVAKGALVDQADPKAATLGEWAPADRNLN
jgi:hypothetical protein